jgi:hypothetical protein
MPWWTGLPLLLCIAAIQAAKLPRLQLYHGIFRRMLRWGFAGLLVASYRAFGDHGLGLTLTLLAALAGFSLLVLLESWQDHKPQRSATLAAASPEWNEMALAPIGPSETLIILQPPGWVVLDDSSEAPAGVTMLGAHRCGIGSACIDNIELSISVAPEQRWIALPMAAWRGVVLYDRVHDKLHRLRGWQLYGWHASEAWLSRGEDQPPLPLSHVLGQDQVDE